jgi:hypothetical protein
MKRLVSMNMYFGRMGSLEGMFVLGETEWDRLQKLIADKTEVYFGEVLGKHSEVVTALKGDDFKVLTEDQSWLDKAVELKVDLNSGHNPLSYFDDMEVEEDE